MPTAKNIILTCIIAFVLLSPIATIAATTIGLEFPSWSEIGLESSELEGRYLNDLTDLNYETWHDKTFQKAFDSYLSDRIPLRDKILLFDATTQRPAISIAAKTFGYDVYHTFYGSEYVIDQKDDLLLLQPEKQPEASKKESKRRKKWIKALNTAAETHPDTRFVIDIVMKPSQCSANPAYALLGADDLIDRNWVESNLVEKLDSQFNVFVDEIADTKELQSLWFRDDHHWQLQRAMESYNSIAKALELEPITWRDDLATPICDKWYGTAARGGRDFEVGSNLIDQADDFSQLHFNKLEEAPEEGSFSPGLREDYYEKGADSVSIPETYTYRDFYGGDAMVITNDNAPNDKTLLLVGDSFTRCLYRYYAKNYRQTIYAVPSLCTIDASLDELISKYDANDVIILAQPTTYKSISTHSPNLMKTAR